MAHQKGKWKSNKRWGLFSLAEDKFLVRVYEQLFPRSKAPGNVQSYEKKGKDEGKSHNTQRDLGVDGSPRSFLSFAPTKQGEKIPKMVSPSSRSKGAEGDTAHEDNKNLRERGRESPPKAEREKTAVRPLLLGTL